MTDSDYAEGQVWLSPRGHRRVVTKVRPPSDTDAQTVLGVSGTYNGPTYWITAAEMDAWCKKHSARLRETVSG